MSGGLGEKRWNDWRAIGSWRGCLHLSQAFTLPYPPPPRRSWGASSGGTFALKMPGTIRQFERRAEAGGPEFALRVDGIISGEPVARCSAALCSGGEQTADAGLDACDGKAAGPATMPTAPAASLPPCRGGGA